MKSLLMLLTALLLLAGVGVGQTNVGGVLTTDQHWTLSGSPYRVTSELTVPLNVTLTIDPGVEVFVESQAKINVTQGTLVAIGQPGNEIRFDGDYPAILVEFTPSATSLTQLSYCSFHSGHTAIWAHPSAWSPSLITDVTFDHLYFYLTRLYVSDVHFEHCGFNRTWLFDRINIDSSWFDYCDISLYTAIGEPFQSTITNSHITYSHIEAQGKYIFVGDTLLHCEFDGVEREDNYAELDHCRVADCSFEGIGGSTWPHHRFKFRNSILLRSEMYANLNIWPQPNNANDPTTELDHCVVQMDGNGSWWTSSSLLNHVAFIGAPNGQDLETSISSTTDCLFWGPNLKPIVYTNSYFPTPTFTGCNFMQIGTKIACYGAPNIDAYNCWWGSTDPQAIDDAIYDGYDHLNYGYVQYLPVLATPNTSAPMSPPTGITVLAGSGYHQISWNPNPESDLAGYAFHYGSFNGWAYLHRLDFGNVTTFQVPDSIFDNGFGLTAYDNGVDGIDDQVEGYESWFTTCFGLPTAEAELQNPIDLQLNAYPNPAADILHVAMQGNIGTLQLGLYDAQGRVLALQSGKGGQFSFDVSRLPAGVYLLHCDAGKAQTTRRVVVH